MQAITAQTHRVSHSRNPACLASALLTLARGGEYLEDGPPKTFILHGESGMWLAEYSGVLCGAQS